MKLKELCEMVGVEYNAKNPKRCLNIISKEYEISKNKNDYTIIRELSADEKRLNKSNIRMKEIFRNTICATLNMINGNKACGSIKDFYELFAIVNSNYSWFKYSGMSEKKIEYMQEHNINISNASIYHEFSIEIDVMFRRMVKETLAQLEREFVIFINKKLTFVYADENGYKRSKCATDEETQKMLEVGRKVLDKYEYENYEDIKFCDKDKIKNEISNELGIEYFYNQYEIILNKEYLSNYNCSELRGKVNELTIKKLSMSRQGVLKEYDIEMLNDCIETIVRI